MGLLIDTNVILDLIFHRSGCNDVIEFFKKIEQERKRLYITASTVTDLFYIIRKETHNTDQTYQVMEDILKIIGILAVTEQDIKAAFEQKWKDFEDCVQDTVAKNNDIECIITGNRKDYADSFLEVMTPHEYVQR